MRDLFEELEKSVSNYNLDEGVSNKNVINDIVNLTEEAEQHGIYSYDGPVTRYGKPIGNMKLETEAASKEKAISNLKFKVAKEAGYSSPAGIGIAENKVKFKLKEYLEDNMYPRTEAYKFILDFVADATDYLDNKDNFINNREEYARAYLYFLDLVNGIKDKRDAGRFLRKILKEKNNNDSFLTKRSIEEVEDNLSVNDPAYVDEFQNQVMELGKKDSIVYEFDTADAKYRETLNLYESKKHNAPTERIVELFGSGKKAKEISASDIAGITLLSIEEAKKLPAKLLNYDSDITWWLRSPGPSSSVANVVIGGNIGNDIYASVDRVCEVRPVLQIKDLKSSNLKIGDVFTFGDEEFKVISDKLALCLSDIGRSVFRKNKGAKDANEYRASDVRKYVSDWLNKAISGQNLTESNSTVGDNKPDENGLLIYTGGVIPEEYRDKVKKVIVKDGVTSIGEWAFYGCTSLTSVDIPSSVTRIWNSAFEYCRKLTIHCKKGSYADRYAREYGIPVEYM